MTGLEIALGNRFDPATTAELTRLAGEYMAAKSGVATWLAKTIKPLAEEWRAALPKLEQAESAARYNLDTALLAADSAAEKFNAAGDDAPLAFQEDKLAAARKAASLRQEWSNAATSTAQARHRLAKIEQLLTDLGQVAPPDPEAIRHLVATRWG